MKTELGKDLRMSTIAAAYGQLKHDFVLVAGEPYAQFGCEIPDGYVEPAAGAYGGLYQYAVRGEQLCGVARSQGQHEGARTSRGSSR